MDHAQIDITRHSCFLASNILTPPIVVYISNVKNKISYNENRILESKICVETCGRPCPSNAIHVLYVCTYVYRYACIQMYLYALCATAGTDVCVRQVIPNACTHIHTRTYVHTTYFVKCSYFITKSPRQCRRSFLISLLLFFFVDISYISCLGFLRPP